MPSKNKPLSEETFVRDLPMIARLKLTQMLEINDYWEELAKVIPKNYEMLLRPDAEAEPRYTFASISLLGSRQRRTNALLDDWGTKNCRLKHLVAALYKAKLIAAADYIQKDLLSKESAVQAVSSTGNQLNQAQGSSHNGFSESVSGLSLNQLPGHPSAIDSTGSLTCLPSPPNHSLPSFSPSQARVTHHGEGYNPAILNSVPIPIVPANAQPSTRLPSNQPPDGAKYEPETKAIRPIIDHTSDSIKRDYVPQSEELQEISFSSLIQMTNNFDTRDVKQGGNLIGQGGFGTVFLGCFASGFRVAVKRLNDEKGDPLEQFKAEVEALCAFQHENLVYLMGYSLDGPYRCLIYQYMPEGSLEDRLALKDDTEPLPNRLRFDICRDTAKAIAFLHKGGLVHRDIKSANILLDHNFAPKVGDFATARIAEGNNMSSEIMRASKIIGTGAYLAPEAHNFNIHPSLDTFSFGVVLLEILTGLPVVDPGREEPSLRQHVLEHCAPSEEEEEDDDEEEPGTIYDLLDMKGGEWAAPMVDFIYQMSCRCLNDLYKRRPKMADVNSEFVNFQTEHFPEVPEEEEQKKEPATDRSLNSKWANGAAT